MFTIDSPPPPNPTDIESSGGHYIRVPDSNRIVEYFVTGSDRLDASIIIDCPGGGCTGRFIGTLPGVAEWCRTNNIRIISPSYPGFGYSEVKKGWTIGEWVATDLDPILRKEGVIATIGEGDNDEKDEGKRFIVTGTSFGGPHAQAIAVHYGPDRVRALGMRVPYVGREVSDAASLPLCPSLGQVNMRYTSTSANSTLFGHVAGRALMAICANPGGFLDEPSGAQRALLGCLQPKALETIAALNEDHGDVVWCLKEDMERGVVCSGQGWLYMCAADTLLDHKFDVRDIKSGGGSSIPMVVWYADDDEDCPPSHSRWLVREFGAKDRVFSGLGHMGGAFVDHVEFLDEVLGASK